MHNLPSFSEFLFERKFSTINEFLSKPINEAKINLKDIKNVLMKSKLTDDIIEAFDKAFKLKDIDKLFKGYNVTDFNINTNTTQPSFSISILEGTSSAFNKDGDSFSSKTLVKFSFIYVSGDIYFNAHANVAGGMDRFKRAQSLTFPSLSAYIKSVLSNYK